jgi:hypothetical protein
VIVWWSAEVRNTTFGATVWHAVMHGPICGKRRGCSGSWQKVGYSKQDFVGWC